MVYWFELVPSQFSLFSVALILIVSCYTFTNTKLKTKDLYFQGFPAVWNIVIFYLFVLDTPQLTNFLAILFFTAMTFVPLKYLHPFRVQEKKTLNLFMLSVWGVCCTLLLIDLRDTLSYFSEYREIYFWLWVVLSLYFLSVTVKRSLVANKN